MVQGKADSSGTRLEVEGLVPVVGHIAADRSQLFFFCQTGEIVEWEANTARRLDNLDRFAIHDLDKLSAGARAGVPVHSAPASKGGQIDPTRKFDQVVGIICSIFRIQLLQEPQTFL